MSWLRTHAVDLALVALVLAWAAPLAQPLDSQQLSRMALTAAVVDDGTVRIDGYPIGVDLAERDGHVYSDKAPGQPFLAIPAYALYRAVGGAPAQEYRYEGNLGLWTVNLWSCVLPTACLLLLIRRAVEEVEPGVGPTIAALVFGTTLLLPFSTVLFGHALSACLAFAGWFAVRRTPMSDRAVLVSGLLFGAAVLTEYTMVLAAAAVGLHVARTAGWRAWRFVAGGIPAAVALGAYQWAAFGSPFSFSYARSSFGEATRAAGDVDQDPALLENAVRVLVGERGLAVVTPILVLAAIGAVLLVRRRSEQVNTAHLAALAAAGSLVLVQMAWSNPTGGDSPGARYATAAAAFLAPGLAVAWARWPRPTRALAIVSALIMLAATWSNPLEARDSRGAIGIWFDKIASGDWALTVYEMALGGWAVALLPLGAAASVAVLVAVQRHPSPATGAAGTAR